MSELSQERVALDTMYLRVKDANDRVVEAKLRIMRALTDEELDAGIADLALARQDRKLLGEIHTSYWRAIGEPGPRDDDEVFLTEADLADADHELWREHVLADDDCGCACDSNCGC